MNAISPEMVGCYHVIVNKKNAISQSSRCWSLTLRITGFNFGFFFPMQMILEFGDDQIGIKEKSIKCHSVLIPLESQRTVSELRTILVEIYLFKVNSWNSRIICKNCTKLELKTPVQSRDNSVLDINSYSFPLKLLNYLSLLYFIPIIMALFKA